MKLLLPALLCAGILLHAPAARATEIAAGTANLEAFLGSSYQSEKQNFPGDRCLTGATKASAGKASAGLSFRSSISESQLSSELGFSIGGRARSGAVEYSLATDFLSNSTSNDLSVSASWESSYSFPVDKLMATKSDMNETGRDLFKNPERWAETCGDEYVAEITRGAKLFFTIRVDFHSKRDKEAFEAKFSVSGPLASAEADLKQASEQFSRGSTVVVSAHQIGGDVSKLSAIFGNTDGTRQNLVKCQLSSFEDCAQVITTAITYANDVAKGFPSQLAPGVLPGPATLTYRTAPYSAIGIYPNNYPGLSQIVKLARQEVSAAFEKNYRYRIAADRLLQEKNSADREAEISSERDKVVKNLDVILGVSETCFNSPSSCNDAVSHHMGLESIDPTIFLPPTFRALCEKQDSESLRTTIAKIRAQMQSPEAETCADLADRLLKANALDLSGQDRPEDALDLRPLATLDHLTSLALAGSKISDLNPLSDLVNLKFLDLQRNSISNLEPLADMVSLVHLNLGYNLISDLRDLSNLLRLQRLFLTANTISDLKPLTFLPQLQSIDLRLNQLDPRAVDTFRQQMPASLLLQY